MEKLLTGKAAFITGGASGIGRATALAFAEEGAKVAVADIKGSREVVDEIAAAGGQAFSIMLDVTDSAAVDAAVDDVVARWGRLDIGFNNAGIQHEMMDTPWGDREIYNRIVDVNQNGVLFCMTAELRHMARQRSGAIINTASIAGLVGISGAGYCGSKHAVVGLTRSAAIQYASQGIRINCVCPGAVVTPLTEFAAVDHKTKVFMEEMHPMKRLGQPREIADGVVFLASDRASFITGHALSIDGGFVAG